MQLYIIGLANLKNNKKITKIIRKLRRQVKKAIKLKLNFDNNNNKTRSITKKEFRNIIIEVVTKNNLSNLMRFWANVTASLSSNNKNKGWQFKVIIFVRRIRELVIKSYMQNTSI